MADRKVLYSNIAGFGEVSGSADTILVSGLKCAVDADFVVTLQSAANRTFNITTTGGGSTIFQVDGGVRFSQAQFYDDFWNTSNWTTRVTTGSVVLQSNDNGCARLTTGAVTTNEESLDFNDIFTFVNTKQPVFEVGIQLGSTANIEIDIGLIGSNASDYIFIKLDASVASTWRLVTSKNGASINTSVGATATTDKVVLRFEWTSDTALEWFIDGVSQGTVSTAANIPTEKLQPVVAVRTETEEAKYFEIDYCKIWQDRV